MDNEGNDSEDKIELLCPEFVSINSESKIVNNTLISTINASVKDCFHSQQVIEGKMVTCGPVLKYFTSTSTGGGVTGAHMKWLNGSNYTVTVEIRGGFSLFIYYLQAYHKDTLITFPINPEDMIKFFNTSETYYIGSENISIQKTDELVDDIEIKYDQPEKGDLTIQFDICNYQNLEYIHMKYDLFNGMRGGRTSKCDEERYQEVIEEGADDIVYGVSLWIIAYPNENIVLVQEYSEYK